MWKTFKASVLKEVFYDGASTRGHKLEDLSLWKQLGSWEDTRVVRPAMEWQWARMIFSYKEKYYEYILIRDCANSTEKWEYIWDASTDRDEECIEVEKVVATTFQYRTWNLEKNEPVPWTGSWCGISMPASKQYGE
jgi:hypothetical protein